MRRKPSFSGVCSLSALVERSHSPTICFAGLVLRQYIFFFFWSPPLREVLCSCNIWEVRLCHWFVFSFLECKWPDFYVLFLKHSGTNAFLSVGHTTPDTFSDHIWCDAFEVSALCCQVTVNLLSMSIVNKVFSLLELFQLINSLICWWFHAHSLPFYATGLHAQVSQSYPLNCVWYFVWSFYVLVASPTFVLEAVFNKVLLVLVFLLTKFIGKSTK